MTQQTVEVPDFPEGWNVVAYRCPESGDYYLENNGIVIKHTGCKHKFHWIIVEKIQPRRIVLEETDEYHEPEDKAALHTQIFNIDKVSAAKIISNKIWKEVKE